MNRRIVAVPGVPQRNYSRLKAGGPGTVFYLETPAGGGAATLQRYRLSDRRAAPFMAGVTDYVISATRTRCCTAVAAGWRTRRWPGRW
jgi:hypothetical protein